MDNEKFEHNYLEDMYYFYIDEFYYPNHPDNI